MLVIKWEPEIRKEIYIYTPMQAIPLGSVFTGRCMSWNSRLFLRTDSGIVSLDGEYVGYTHTTADICDYRPVEALITIKIKKPV